MAGWSIAKVRGKTKNTLIKLKKDKGLTEDELVEYALLKAFGKVK